LVSSYIAVTYQHPFYIILYSKLPIFVATLVGLLALLVITKVNVVMDPDFSVIVSALLSQSFDFPPVLPQLLTDDWVSLDPSLSINCILGIITFYLICVMLSWARVLVQEGRVGLHVYKVQRSLKLGMLLFIISEIMLFFPFFWAFLHFSLAPSVFIGAVWPPFGLEKEILDPFMLPLVNTVTLLCSGVTLISSHRSIIHGNKSYTVNMLYLTIIWGILFSWLQFIEYGLTSYTINDGVFGSTFFMLTGLHGFHVIVGTCLLIISYWRVINKMFSTKHHVGFETSAWYWHFVDIVWLGVYSLVYVVVFWKN